MHGGSWLTLLGVFGLSLLLNLVCWSPGVGSSDGVNPPGRPRGTEFEQFFGWPALYRAELWRSEDLGLFSRILRAAPFYSPAGEMTLQTRRCSIVAVLIDILVGAILGLLSVMATECIVFGAWNRWPKWACPSLMLILLALFWAADRASVLL